MPLSDAQYKALVVVEVGDDDAGTVAANVATLWTKNDDKPDLFVQYLYTKRDAILLLMGRVRQQVSFRALDGASVNLSDLSAHLKTLLDATEALLAEQADLLRSGAIGQLATTAPTTPPVGWPDANDPRYKGSPYWPLPRIPGGKTPQ